MLDERDGGDSRLFNGTNVVHFALDSTVTGTTRVFETMDDLRAEIIDARVYGGMHFRNSVEVGATMGEHVADWVAFAFRGRHGHHEKEDRRRR
jgi:hypothetical protein